MSKKNNIFSRIRSIFIAPADTSLASIVNTNNIDFGVDVNASTALKFTAVFAAIKILSENIAALPKRVMKVTADGLVPATDHAAARLLAGRPNAYTDKFIFWFSMLASALGGNGNAYAVIKSKGATPDSLHQVPSGNVRVKMVEGEKMYIVAGLIGDLAFLNGTYMEWEMIHIMYFSLDGIRGIDPIAYNAAAIGRGIATQKFSAEFYKKGGNIKGVLETDGHMGDDEYDAFMRHYKSSGNFDTPILEYGLKYKSIGISPVAAQLIQSETLSIQDIARIYSIPPHLLAEMSHSTFSNIEQQNLYFASYSLRPLCKRIEEQLEEKLFLDSERGQYEVKFDLKGMMRGDDAARANYYASGINAGWLTPNEARRQEGLASKPGLDTSRLPLNTAYVDENGKITNPNNDDGTIQE